MHCLARTNKLTVVGSGRLLVQLCMPLVPVSCQIVAVWGSALADSPSACCFRLSIKGILARDSVLFTLC